MGVLEQQVWYLGIGRQVWQDDPCQLQALISSSEKQEWGHHVIGGVEEGMKAAWLDRP